jgi:mono/diheme cytochrome c family protein
MFPILQKIEYCNMKNFKITYIIVLISAIAFSCNSDSQSAEAQSEPTPNSAETMVAAGEKTFNQNCKMCHGINASESSGMAPILDSVKTHWPDKTALAKYIKNAKENLQINAHTKALYETWKDKPQMPPYLGLNDGEVDELVAYLHAVSN